MYVLIVQLQLSLAFSIWIFAQKHTFAMYPSLTNLGGWSSLSTTFTVSVTEAEKRFSGFTARSWNNTKRFRSSNNRQRALMISQLRLSALFAQLSSPVSWTLKALDQKISRRYFTKVCKIWLILMQRDSQKILSFQTQWKLNKQQNYSYKFQQLVSNTA